MDMTFKKTVITFALSGFSAFLLLQSCGPMNGANPGTGFNGAGASDTTNSPPSPEMVTFSQKHTYIIVTKLLNGEGENNATPPGGKYGTADFNVRIVHAADFSPVAKNVQLVVKYVHTSSKMDGTTAYPITTPITLQSDGSYDYSVPMRGHGNWEIHTLVSETGTPTTALGDDNVLPIQN